MRTGTPAKPSNKSAGPAAAGLPPQKTRIIGKARNEALDMVGEFGVTAAEMRQVGIRLAGLLRFARPHGVGIDRVPFDDGAGTPIGRHAAHGEDVVVDRSAIGGQQADRHHRIGDDVHGGVESLAFGVGILCSSALGCRIVSRSIGTG